jgi:hypothetical protein
MARSEDSIGFHVLDHLSFVGKIGIDMVRAYLGKPSGKLVDDVHGLLCRDIALVNCQFGSRQLEDVAHLITSHLAARDEEIEQASQNGSASEGGAIQAMSQ